MIAFALFAALAAPPDPPQAIVVTATSGYRHESIEIAEEVIAQLARSTGWFAPRFVRTEEELPAAMTTDELARSAVVMFVNTTGELRWPERRRLLEWVARGGTFIGVHSAADTWHEWPEFLEMLGGEFESHPPDAAVDVFVDDPRHPATRGLPTPYRMTEEIYLFRRFSPDRVSMLLSLRASPEDGAPGFFPLAWHRAHGEGRVLYTALGHRLDVWESEWFRLHLQGLIEAALQSPAARRRAVAP